jgi:hypothetical protein
MQKWRGNSNMSDTAMEETKTYQDSLVYDCIKVDPYLAIEFLKARITLKDHLLECSQNLNIDTLKTLQHMTNIVKELEILCLTNETITSTTIMNILEKKM